MSIKPEVPGGIGTIVMCVNMIPHVINATPDLKHDWFTSAKSHNGRYERFNRKIERKGYKWMLKGDWVRIHNIVLEVGERAPNVPEDTQNVPLKCGTRDFY